MKKIFLVLLFTIIAVGIDAQIYSRIEYRDKFDVKIKVENTKVLITETDSTFTIEKRGFKPTTYYILNELSDYTIGDRNNIVDLTGTSVYGYQETWCVIRVEDIENYRRDYLKYICNEAGIEIISKYYLFVIHRVISKYSFIFEYKSEYFWIEDESNTDKLGKSIDRILYCKD